MSQHNQQGAHFTYRLFMYKLFSNGIWVAKGSKASKIYHPKWTRTSWQAKKNQILSPLQICLARDLTPTLAKPEPLTIAARGNYSVGKLSFLYADKDRLSHIPSHSYTSWSLACRNSLIDLNRLKPGLNYLEYDLERLLYKCIFLKYP